MRPSRQIAAVRAAAVNAEKTSVARDDNDIQQAYESLLTLFQELGPPTANQVRLERLGAHMAAALAWSGKKRAELAEKMSVSKGRITRLLSGDANPTATTLFEFADALNIQVEIVFRSLDEKPIPQIWELRTKYEKDVFDANRQVKAKIARKLDDKYMRLHDVVQPSMIEISTKVISHERKERIYL